MMCCQGTQNTVLVILSFGKPCFYFYFSSRNVFSILGFVILLVFVSDNNLGTNTDTASRVWSYTRCSPLTANRQKAVLK